MSWRLSILKIIQSVRHFLTRIAESNLRNTLDLTNKNHRFSLSSHVFNFFFFLVFGLVFYADLFIFSGSIFSGLSSLYDLAVPDLLGVFHRRLDSSCLYMISSYFDPPLETCRNEPGATLFYHSVIFGFLLSVGIAIYYYARHGHEHDRSGDANFYFHGYMIPIITHFVLGWFVVIAFVVGSYLIAVYGPEYSHLRDVPGFFIVQIFLNAVAHQLITSGLVSQWKIALPYSLHPKISHGHGR